MSSELSSTSLSVYYQNVNGLRTKIEALGKKEKILDMYSLTETWLNENYNSEDLFDPIIYEVFRRDRDTKNSTKKIGGGCLIAIKKSSDYEIIHQTGWQNGLFEDLWITLKYNCGRLIHILCVYLPPSLKVELYNIYLDSITDLIPQLEKGDIFLLGDFNAKNDERLEPLQNLIDFCGLVQNKTERNAALDFVISNTYVKVEESSNPIISLDRHHPAIEFCINLSPIKRDKETLKYRNYKNVNWAELDIKLLEVDWSILGESFDDTEKLLNIFYEKLNSILDLFCPLIIKSTTDPNEISKVNYFVKYIENIEKKLINNPKTFWFFISERRSAGIADFVHLDDELSVSPKDTVQLFLKQFDIKIDQSTQGTSFSSSLFCSGNFSNVEIEFRSFIYVSDKLLKLNISKSAGPDGLPSILFKNCILSLSFPLYVIFRSSLFTRCMPKKLKQAYVVPTHKSGSLNDVKNYRPLAKLNVIAEVIDSLMADHLSMHFSERISKNQHWFFKKDSNIATLSAFNKKLQQCMKVKGQLDVIQIDFSKTFEKVNKQLFLNKLDSLGVCDIVLEWFQSFLNGRTQQIKIGDSLSSMVDVTSSVISGSRCSQLLFSLFVLNINNIIDTECSLHVDDFKTWNNISSNYPKNDCIKLQNNIIKIYDFFKSIGVELNVKNFSVMTFTKRYSKTTTEYEYKISDRKIARKTLMQHLDVNYDKKLEFSAHLSQICIKGTQICGFIIKNSKDFKNYETEVALYKSLVRPLLVRDSNIWASTAKVLDLQLIEKVEHNFIRYLARKYFQVKSNEIDYGYYKSKFEIEPIQFTAMIEE